jgi:uncharacterized protein (TIGR01244 family)
MKLKKPITETITVGDQPDEGDLQALRDEGYLGVVNLRNDGEPEQPLDTGAEGELVKGMGLDYLHYGVSSAPLTDEGVHGVSMFLDQHAAGKTLVHCRKGGRAMAMVLLHLARKEGWKADEAFAKGAELGLTVEGGLRQLVENHLRHAEASPS